jgi:hypothetical protein
VARRIGLIADLGFDRRTDKIDGPLKITRLERREHAIREVECGKMSGGLNRKAVQSCRQHVVHTDTFPRGGFLIVGEKRITALLNFQTDMSQFDS